MAAFLEHASDDRARVTQGIPALSPELRRDITESQLKLAYQHTLQAEYQRNEQAATDSDGAIQNVTNWDEIVGIPLVGARIIGRLKKLNKNLWFEISEADRSKTGIYLLKNGLQKEFICGMETELNPEFSLRVLDKDGTPKGIISGWRRILTRLIRAKLITESGAWSMFGPPSRSSQNWARFTA